MNRSETLGSAPSQEGKVSTGDWLERMRRSLALGHFSVAYQPFIRVSTGQVVGVEALARWTHPEEGQISPSRFIPLAEENGFIGEFTEWMIHKALGEVAALSSDLRELVVSVNVSPIILTQPAFVAFLDRSIQASERSRLVIEITDREHLDEGEEEVFQSLTNELMERGFRFAIDDFGTGHLDLRRVVLCPAHILKTNVSLIRNPERERRGQLALGLVADLARELNMRLLAEGVENREQWETVRSFGIEYAKGYYICAPLEAGALEDWLRSVSSGATTLPGREWRSNLDQSEQARPGVGEWSILVVNGDDDWHDTLKEKCANVLFKGSMDSASGMLEHFDFLVCVLRVERVTTEHLAFLQQRRRFQPDLPVIVVAADLDNRWLIQLMREGVTDFILGSEPAEVVDRILEHVHLRKAALNSRSSSERMVRCLRDRMEWESYKESRTLSTDNRFGQKTINHLRVSLTQGAGFGLLLTIVEMIANQQPREDGTRIIAPHIMKLALENAQIASRHIKGLDAFVDLMQKDLPLKRIGTREFFHLIVKGLADIPLFYGRKGLKLNLPSMNGWGDFSLELEPSHFQLALQELAVNAYKYSVPNTEVDLVATLRTGYLCLGFKNIVAQEPYGGVPEEVKEQVTEPFYRLHPPVEDGIEFETFGLGVGLTAVKFIMHKHRGMLSIRDVRDHSRAQVRPAVLASIYFPVDAGEASEPGQG